MMEDCGCGDEVIVTIVAKDTSTGEFIYYDEMVYDEIDKYSSVLNTCELQEGYYEVSEGLEDKSVDEIKDMLIKLGGLKWDSELKEIFEEDF